MEETTKPKVLPKKTKKTKKDVVATVGPDGIKVVEPRRTEAQLEPPDESWGETKPITSSLNLNETRVGSSRQLIAHLKINSSEVVFYDNPIIYDPNPPIQPQPWDSHGGDPFMSESVALRFNTNIFSLPEFSSDNSFAVGSLVTIQEEHLSQDIGDEVENMVKSGKWNGNTVLSDKNTTSRLCQPNATIRPEIKSQKKTDLYIASSEIGRQNCPEVAVACWWCCHHFIGQPVIIPWENKMPGWTGDGHFCSPSCALAYLLVQQIDSHIRWERISLLNRLYGDGISRIYPAPAREFLTMFGGSKTIDEFRLLIDEAKYRIDIHYPPVTSILTSVDTKPIDFYETNLFNTGSKNKGIEERLARAEEGLRLKRTKPLKDRENTLDVCMNIVRK